MAPLRLSRLNVLGLLRSQKVPAATPLVSSRKGYTSFGGAPITLGMKIETKKRSPVLKSTGVVRLIVWRKALVPSPVKGVNPCV